MSNILETNVLIVGKSGVGKSSLINYIFNKEMMETGTGRPVTEKGIFTEKLKISNDFIANISDTWGIEANKSEEWKKLIEDEVRKHDSEDVSSWFHTIFFCFSAKSARVEDFEKEIAKSLVQDGNKVIAVLTHSDTNNIDSSVYEMSKELKSIGIEEQNIVKVCSVGKKLLGGKSTKIFGKEELLYCIKNNLWETICGKLPKIMDMIIDDCIDNWYYQSLNCVENKLTWYNNQSNKKLDELSSQIKALLDKELETLKSKLDRKYDEAYNYYVNLTKKYQIVSIEKKEPTNLGYNFDFKLDAMDRLAENIATFIISLIPFAIFFTGAASKELRKEDIMRNIANSKRQIAKELKSKNRKEIENIKNYQII